MFARNCDEPKNLASLRENYGSALTTKHTKQNPRRLRLFRDLRGRERERRTPFPLLPPVKKLPTGFTCSTERDAPLKPIGYILFDPLKKLCVLASLRENYEF